MTRILLILLLTMGVAAAQPVPPADRDAIVSTITRQIEAFRHDDAAAAFGFAAPNIQTTFGSAQSFMGMVAHAYPPVYRPRSVEPTDLVEQDGEIIQKVELIGPDGVPETALYSMQKQPDGTWKIAGCALVPSVRVGA